MSVYLTEIENFIILQFIMLLATAEQSETRFFYKSNIKYPIHLAVIIYFGYAKISN